MLFKNSFSKTKRFFKNTLQNFKSLLSGGYQRLPKTPPFNPFSCAAAVGDSKTHPSFRDLENFYADFTNRWDFEQDKDKGKRVNKKKSMKEKEPMKEEEICNGSFMKFAKQGPVQNRGEQRRENVKEERSANEGDIIRGRGIYLVTQKLKELELMDVSNVDHVLDIEEVLHYYSRLTCPFYLDIVDRFFMQMYSEFYQSVNS